MKKYLLFAATLILLPGVKNAKAQNCCNKNSDMQLLAANSDFRSAHSAPEPMEYHSENGKMRSFPVAGGADGNAFYIPCGQTTSKVLIVVHEWWGLNDYIKREAVKWQNELGNVDVYAVDLYDGKVTAHPDEAGELMGALKKERGNAIIKGLLKQIGTDKKVATIGWCMGGSWSFNATLLADRSASGCVMYYGFPEADAYKISALKTDVLYIYGTKDNYIRAEHVKAFGTQVKKTGHTFTRFDFDAVHAFANPSNPHYNAEMAEKAHVHALEFLKKHLGI